MSTIETFRAMSGISQISSLEITPQRAQEIIETVSSNHPQNASSTAVNLLPVSSYVTQAKPGMPGSASIVPNMPPFASHLGIVIGVPQIQLTALLLHLVLDEDEEDTRSVMLAANYVGLKSKSIKGGEVKQVGETRFSIPEIIRIGEEMISAFGNYHLVFWNCQVFAKCYLRVITSSDATFNHWTTADVTNLFLCAFVIPTPIVSSSKSNEQRRMRLLHGVGTQAANGQRETQAAEGELEPEAEGMVTDEDLFKASDEAIDLMKEAIADNETFKKLSSPVKDSSDKRGLIQGIKSLWQKVTG
jgi:hypothetical protein